MRMPSSDVGIVADTILLDTFDLKKVPLNIPNDTRLVYIAYNQTRHLSAACQQFIDYLKQYKEIS